MIQSLQYVYWLRKAQFLLESDTYTDWVLFAVEEGAFRYRIGEAEGTAEPGSVVACPPGTDFWRRASSPVSFHFLRFGFEEESAPPPLTAGQLRVSSPARLAADVAHLRRIAHDATSEAEALRRHLLQDLLYFCFPVRDREPDSASPTAADPLMASAMSTIRERAHERTFGIGQAAELAGLTPVQFSRRFHAAFRVTPIQFLTDCRIQLAKELLANTNLTLDRIAERCGYENAFYLSRVFKRMTHINPSAYRKASQV